LIGGVLAANIAADIRSAGGCARVRNDVALNRSVLRKGLFDVRAVPSTRCFARIL